MCTLRLPCPSHTTQQALTLLTGGGGRVCSPSKRQAQGHDGRPAGGTLALTEHPLGRGAVTNHQSKQT